MFSGLVHRRPRPATGSRARAARAAPSVAQPGAPPTTFLLLDGLGDTLQRRIRRRSASTQGKAADLRSSTQSSHREEGRPLALAGPLPPPWDVWDEETWAVLPDLQVKLIPRLPAHSPTLHLALSMAQSGAHGTVRRGSPAGASLIAELASGHRGERAVTSRPYGALLAGRLGGHRKTDACLHLIDTVHDEVCGAAADGNRSGPSPAGARRLLYGSLGQIRARHRLPAHQIVALPPRTGRPDLGSARRDHRGRQPAAEQEEAPPSARPSKD